MNRKEAEHWLDMYAGAVRVGAHDTVNEIRAIILDAMTTTKQNVDTIETFQRQDGTTLYAVQKE